MRSHYLSLFSAWALWMSPLFVLNAQHTIDSLQRIVATATDETARFENLVFLAEAYRDQEKAETALQLLNDSYAAAAALEHPAMADLYYQVALTYEDQQQVDSAIVAYEQTIQLAQRFDNRALEANALMDQGYMYSVKNELQKGLDLNGAAYAIASQIDDPKVLRRVANSLGRSYSFVGKFDSSNIYLQEALDLQRDKLGANPRRMFELHSNIGNNYGRSGQMEAAISEYEKGLKLMLMANDSNGVCHAYRNIGATHYFNGKYPAALEVLNKAVSFLEGSNRYEDQIVNFDYLGDVYLAIEDYENAGLYWQRAADTWQRANADEDNPDLRFKVGRVRLLQGKPQEALDAISRAVQLKEESGQYVDGEWYRYLGQAHQQLGQYDQAVEDFQRAIEQAPVQSQELTIRQSLLGLGQISEELQQYTQAKLYYQQAEQVSKNEVANEADQRIAAGLYRMFKREGNTAEALRFLEQSKTIQDSIFNKKNIQAITRLQATNEFEQEKRELAYQQTRERERQANIRGFLWVALVVSIIGLLIGALYYRSKQKANQQLSKLNAEIRQQKEKLEELDDSKSRFFTNISHEFRTPLTIIKGMAQKVRDKPEVHLEKGTGMIQRNALNLLDLVNQILDLRKLESKELKLHYKQGDVIAYLKYLTESHSSHAEQHGLLLHFSTEIPELNMDYDAEKLLRIVSNLLSNAVKFSSSGGNIYFRLAQRQEEGIQMLRLQVEDQGIGIAPESLPYVFDRFYQADAPSTRQGEGTGIGLALTQELVALMGGTIQVSSQLQQGTRFTILLPVTNTAVEHHHTSKNNSVSPPSVTEAPKDEISRQVVPSSAANERPKLLVVEDNADVRQYLVAALEDYYDIDLAANGAMGIDRAIETVPDLIISDVMMPEKDGYELTATLKQDERTDHIPIILLTAKSDIDSKISGLEKGADAYLAKPFEERELFVRIDKLLALRKTLQDRYATFEVTTDAPVPVIEDPFLQKLHAYVEDHISDTELNMEKLSKGMGMSRTQVFRKLKALTGTSPTLFIRSIRLQKGKQLLTTTDLTVSEVAYDVGFTSLSYFSTAFTEEFGVRPSTLRK